MGKVATRASKRTSKLDTYLGDNHVARGIYEKIRERASNIVISGYDITKKCNLRCEGCFFFEGQLSSNYEDDKTLEEYKQFFTAEKDRGITYPHFAGAEPGMVQERLDVAGHFWNRGLIYTNGTFAFDKSLKLMIHVSVWGDTETDKRLRGGAVFNKALKHAVGDERIVFMYTINHQNIKDIEVTVKKCVDNGVRISFNHYSPSNQYIDKLNGQAQHEVKSTFRFSTPKSNLNLTAEDLTSIQELLDRLIDEFPETVIYSKHYNAYINAHETPWQIDPVTKRSTNCVILNKPYHRQYHTDFSYDDGECCIANVDCKDCRHYVAGYTQVMSKFKSSLKDSEKFYQWLDVYDTWCRLHFINWDAHVTV